MKALFIFLFCTSLIFSPLISAEEIKLGDTAPNFQTLTHENKNFDLSTRKGLWTVLYFYPKAETPGCTKQACAFRDTIELIRKQGADVFGISGDTVEDQEKFHKAHNLNFTLLADPEAKIISLYGSKIPLMKMSKRWTFIIDNELKIRSIEKDVDPAMDAARVAKEIEKLKVNFKKEY
jgi:peroxiredoxin Q/BCP